MVLTELTPTKAPAVFHLGTSSSRSSIDQSTHNGGNTGSGPAMNSPGPLAAVKALFLPEGFPNTVTPDYL